LIKPLLGRKLLFLVGNIILPMNDLIKDVRMGFRKAKDTDLTLIETLLSASNLSFEDCFKHLSQFLVYEENELIVGIGGAEVYDEVALLRSIAVHSEHRGLGLARAIFLGLKTELLKQGVQDLYLLTDSAELYFKHLGFAQIERDKVPQEIKQTEQFSSLCPSSAQVMTLRLK